MAAFRHLLNLSAFRLGQLIGCDPGVFGKGLIKNTKLLGALGTMLLLYAFPNSTVAKLIARLLP